MLSGLGWQAYTMALLSKMAGLDFNPTDFMGPAQLGADSHSLSQRWQPDQRAPQQAAVWSTRRQPQQLQAGHFCLNADRPVPVVQARAELWIREWHLSPSQSRDLYLACADLLRTVSKVQSLPPMLSTCLEGPLCAGRPPQALALACNNRATPNASCFAECMLCAPSFSLPVQGRRLLPDVMH